MLGELLQHIRNWFAVPGRARTANYTIKDGTLDLPFLLDGQYFKLTGSVFNNGLHKYPATDLVDEHFWGTVYPLAIPAEVVALAEEIEEWNKKNAAAAAGVYQSESFGGYSYTLKANADNEISWQTAFAPRLHQWRKM